VSDRVVYDTMVLLQGAARPGRIHATLQAIRQGRLTLCLSGALLVEVEDVLNRATVREKFPALTPAVAKAFIDDLLAHGTVFVTTPHLFTWPQHPDDDHSLNLAIVAKAKYLVTWEKRIIKLGMDATPAAKLFRKLVPDLKIVSPKTLAETLKTES
jgi:putative PIN family toxin of toxin-antitoxin system